MAHNVSVRRKTKKIDEAEHIYTYAGGRLLRETYGNHVLDFAYDTNGSPYTLTYDGTKYYYITNVQGDVMCLVDANGETVVQYTYDPWGKLLSTSGRMADTLGEINPIRYRGYCYDTETGFYYLQSRYYDPAVCRFINADVFASTGQGFLGYNMFAYCGNDPVNNNDPSGELGVAIGLFIAGSTIIGGLAGAFTAVCTGSSVLEGVLEGAALGAVAATATIFVPQLIAPVANAIAAVASSTAVQTSIASAVTLGSTFVSSAIGGVVVDYSVQRISHEFGDDANKAFTPDRGRLLKTGMMNGVAGIVPTYGEPAEALGNAIGSLIIGFDASFINSALDVFFSIFSR